MNIPRPDFSGEKKIQLNQNDRINTADFIFSKKLNKDRFKHYYVVEKAQAKKQKKLYLAKILRRNKDKNQDKSYEQIQSNLLNEANILRQLRYPSIIQYIGYSLNGIDQKHQPALVMEYGSQGLLFDIIKETQKGNKPNGWDDTKKLINIYGIASAISYLHSNNVLHRNLNTNNIYENEKFYPLVANFENSVVLNKGEETYPDKGNTIGFAMYVAPEILKNQIYSKSSDIYSFGMIVYEIMSNSIPFEGLEVEEIKQSIQDGKRPTIDDNIPKVYKELIENCWPQEPNNRLTITDIIYKLKNDKNFITSTVDSNEYESYIKYISDFFLNYSAELEDEDDEDDSLIKRKDFKRESLNKTKIMKKLKKVRLISEEDFYEVFKVKVKNTHKKFIGKIFYVYFDDYQHEGRDKIINVMNKILRVNHPSILRSIDFSEYGFGQEYRPTLVTEYNENLSLETIIKRTAPSKIFEEFNLTKKLINIYGIAKGLSYLRTRNIEHFEITPSNIIEDKNLYPKIKDFLIEGTFESIKTLAKIHDISPYSSPETFTDTEYKESDEVYSYSLIVYSIMSNEIPFENIKNTDYINIIDNNLRPTLSSEIPEAYRKLIEKCWSQEPTQRPTFQQIISQLETNDEFITPEINSKEFQDYIEKIKTFETNNKQEDKTSNETSTTDTDDKPKRKESKSDDNDDNDDDDPSRKHLPSGGGGGHGSDSDGDDNDNDSDSDSENDEEEEEEEEEEEFISNQPFIADVKRINLKNYVKGDLLGTGGVSNVYKASKLNNDLLVYAAKEFRRDIYTGPLANNNIISKNLLRELQHHSQASHPSIVQFIGYSPTNFERTRYQPVAMLEFVEKGTLEDIIINIQNKGKVSGWDDTKRLINIYGIASAMRYLHLKKILHRDLKLLNVLVDESLNPKLNDFDLSIDFSEISEETKAIGTGPYIAPEIYSGQIYSEKSDVYAYGVLVYEIMTNELVLRKLSFYNIMCRIFKGNYLPSLNNKQIPQCYKDLINSCWSMDPKKRPTFDDIVKNLRNNQDFITETVDGEAYHAYIKMIDKD